MVYHSVHMLDDILISSACAHGVWNWQKTGWRPLGS